MDDRKIAYEKVEQDLEQRIASGEFDASGMLPTEKSLEEYYRVSRTTIRRAAEILEEKQLIQRIQGHGTRITRIPAHNIYRKFHNVVDVKEHLLLPPGVSTTPLYSYVNVDQVLAPKDISDFLGTDPDEPVFRVQRISTFEDIAFSFTINYFPRALCPDLDHHSGEFTNLYPFLEDHYGIYYDHGSDTVTACTATLVDSKMLNVRPGEALLKITRHAFTKEGPLEYAVTKIPANLFSIELLLQGTPTYYR